ncbi:MAG: stage II sporulation protein E (SpoIIE) [Gemmatimonadetes bacterium]|nr:MAG: stage II sporulation protein E (SpoIIE) [Gemmatimonadota bacterium]
MDRAALIDWGVATLTLPGERESGDLHLVKPVRAGVLVSVVDGLGHGAAAAAAARAAVAALNRHAQESVLPLLQRCHQALAGTRGAVVSVALFDRADGSMTWLGVGNVEGVLLYADAGGRRGRERLVTRGGIVGSELPPLRAEVLAVAPGDTLVLATDGIQSGFADELTVDAPPQQLADQILARSGKSTDDALVLVARYVGDAGAKG